MAELTALQKQYILHWGEMGTRWGINRTVAQIHALLYLSPKALPAEEIAETLSVARSNVSTSLRELQGWRIVRVVHVLGDRRDHFESMKDVWEMFRLVIEQRKRREIDPTREMLRQIASERTGYPVDILDPDARIEADLALGREAVEPLMHERMRKRLVSKESPDTRVLREAMRTAGDHMDYLDYLLDHRRWLAGPADAPPGG